MSIPAHGRSFRYLTARWGVLSRRGNLLSQWIVRRLALLESLAYVGGAVWLPYETSTGPAVGRPADRVRLDDSLEVNIEGVWLLDRG